MFSQPGKTMARRAQLSELCPSCPSPRDRHNSESCAGFTLVELLLVMFVMSVLVALVVGVGTYVIDRARMEETVTTQTRILAAVAAYRNVTNRVPDTASDPNTSLGQLITTLRAEENAKEWANGTSYAAGDIARDNPDASYWTCAFAHSAPGQLFTFAQARAANVTYWKMHTLKTKIYRATKPFLGEGTTVSTTDAYGVQMRYYSDRGLGGKPLILSAGPDGDFGRLSEKRRKDNIRSDTRE